MAATDDPTGRHLDTSLPGAPIESFRPLIEAAALDYDERRDRPLRIIGEYLHPDGTLHAVAITEHPLVRWRLVDVAPDRSAVLADALPGCETSGEAASLAGDYLEQCRAHARGDRAEHPLGSNPDNLKVMTMTYATAP
jgi:hypothetical protein